MDINEIRAETISMGDRVYEMIALIEKGFMENKSAFLTEAMEKEGQINEMEKTLTSEILGLSKVSKGQKAGEELAALQQMVETFERMGDEAAGLVERIEIKVAEGLLFSETGVAQFNETYDAMKKSVEMMRDFLKKRDAGLKERVINNGFHVKALVERFRKEHSERLVKGLCTPMAGSMFFDMLDFTGNLARHSSNVVKLF